jgi:hypothetical protein
MPVYFIRSGETGPVKIGWADEVEKRRRQLQTSHYEPLCVIRVIEGARSLERWLHERFAGWRLHGEWFQFHADMLATEPPKLGEAPAKRPKKERLPVVSWAAERCHPGNLCQRCLEFRSAVSAA